MSKLRLQHKDILLQMIVETNKAGQDSSFFLLLSVGLCTAEVALSYH